MGGITRCSDITPVPIALLLMVVPYCCCIACLIVDAEYDLPVMQVLCSARYYWCDDTVTVTLHCCWCDAITVPWLRRYAHCSTVIVWWYYLVTHCDYHCYNCCCWCNCDTVLVIVVLLPSDAMEVHSVVPIACSIWYSIPLPVPITIDLLLEVHDCCWWCHYDDSICNCYLIAIPYCLIHSDAVQSDVLLLPCHSAVITGVGEHSMLTWCCWWADYDSDAC